MHVFATQSPVLLLRAGSCDDVEGSPPPKGHNSKGSNTTLLKLKQLSFTALTAAAACALVLILAQGLTAQWNAQRHPKTPIIISGLPVSCQYSAGTASNKVAIVITVHGALAYLAGCLSTLAQHTTGVHLFIADDSTNATESATVKAMLQTIPLPSTHIVMGDDPKGYTLTVNAGLRQAHKQGFQVRSFWLAVLLGRAAGCKLNSWCVCV